MPTNKLIVSLTVVTAIALVGHEAFAETIASNEADELMPADAMPMSRAAVADPDITMRALRSRDPTKTETSEERMPPLPPFFRGNWVPYVNQNALIAGAIAPRVSNGVRAHGLPHGGTSGHQAHGAFPHDPPFRNPPLNSLPRETSAADLQPAIDFHRKGLSGTRNDMTIDFLGVLGHHANGVSGHHANGVRDPVSSRVNAEDVDFALSLVHKNDPRRSKVLRQPVEDAALHGPGRVKPAEELGLSIGGPGRIKIEAPEDAALPGPVRVKIEAPEDAALPGPGRIKIEAPEDAALPGPSRIKFKVPKVAAIPGRGRIKIKVPKVAATPRVKAEVVREESVGDSPLLYASSIKNNYVEPDVELGLSIGGTSRVESEVADDAQSGPSRLKRKRADSESWSGT